MNNPTQGTAGILRGKRVLVACTNKTAGSLEAGLKQMGASVLALPVIEIREPADTFQIDACLGRMREYDWIVFTSSYGVQYFLHHMARNERPIDELANAKICPVGPGTADSLNQAGIAATLLPDRYAAEGVLEALIRWYGERSGLAGRRILFPRAGHVRDLLPRALRDAGALVDSVIVYENVPARISSSTLTDIRSAPADLVVFTSSLSVRSLLDQLGPEDGKHLLNASTVAVMGSITANTVIGYLKIPEVIPEVSTVPSLLAAVRDYFDHPSRRG